MFRRIYFTKNSGYVADVVDVFSYYFLNCLYMIKRRQFVKVLFTVQKLTLIKYTINRKSCKNLQGKYDEHNQLS